jgi:hypothetical protein
MGAEAGLDKIFSNRWFHLIVILGIAGFVIVAYSNTFKVPFQFDDLPQIVKNFEIRDLDNIPGLLKRNRGVTLVTFALNYRMGGLDTTGYHAVNIAIHILNAILAYFFVLATLGFAGLGPARSRGAAAFSALIFAIHPIQTQAVTYIVQRMESLSSLFFLAALLIFIKGARARSVLARSVLYGLVALSYVLGFYAKEIVITIPAIILLYDIYFISNGRVKSLVKRWPMYALLAVLLAYFTVNTVVPLGGFNDLSAESATAEPIIKEKPGRDSRTGVPGRIGAPSEQPPAKETGPARAGLLKRKPTAGFAIGDFTAREYLMTQFNVIVYYSSLLLVPANQNLDYDFPVSKGLFEVPAVNEGAVLNYPIPPPVVSLILLLGVAGAGVYLYLRSLKVGPGPGRVISFFIFWFFIILSPTSSFIPIKDVIYEHRVYLPSLGFFVISVLCLNMLFDRLGKKRPDNP